MKAINVRVAVGCLIGVLLAASESTGGTRGIRVALVLYDAPSNQDTVADPFTLGTLVTDFSQMPIGGTVYLEAWVTTEWATGLTGAGLDVTYDPAVVSTFCNRNDPGDPANCQVFLGNWSSFSMCPGFVGLPPKICSDTGEPCATAVDCEACVGGPNPGGLCTTGNKICSDTGVVCTSPVDCFACTGGTNDGLACSVSIKVCASDINQECLTNEDCLRCVGGANDRQICTIPTVCSSTGATCVTAADCFACTGGANNALACTVGDMVCSSTGKLCTTAADCFACTGGANTGLACTIGDKVCSTTGGLCTTANDCKACVGGDNPGAFCTTNVDCLGGGTCEVSGEACEDVDCPGGVCEVSGEVCEDVDCPSGVCEVSNETCVDASKVCSSTGKACAAAADCFTCTGGASDGLGCTIGDTVCSSTRELCATATDCFACTGGANTGLVCTIGDKVCSTTGGLCTTANDCKACVGGDNPGAFCSANADCLGGGTCEVSGEACEDVDCPGGVCEVSGEVCEDADCPSGVCELSGEVCDAGLCSSSGHQCVTVADCLVCAGGGSNGLACTIGDKVCSTTAALCTTATDCSTCTGGTNSGLACTIANRACTTGGVCTTDADCKRCVGGDSPGQFCATDGDCLGAGTCVLSGDSCEYVDCPSGVCEVSGEVCEDADCPGGVCELPGETCDDEDCRPGGTCQPERCDDVDCRLGGTCEVSGATCDDEDCSPGGACEVSGAECVNNPERDCVPIPGVVQNVGGSNLSGIPTLGFWSRIATIEFDVLVAPTSVTAFIAGQDETAVGGRHRRPTAWGGGAADPSEIQFFGWAIPGGASDSDECFGGSENGNPCVEDADCPGTGAFCWSDGVLDALDNCPDKFNPGQEDSDNDNVGDACDNCPIDHNPGQEDVDGDTLGDLCDNCPEVPNLGQEDTDECVNSSNAGDPCILDSGCPGGSCASDGIGDVCDNCPDDLNSDQADCDVDGTGDVCEEDIDADGFPDDCDNCPVDNNPGQEDGDGDFVGDSCDNCPNDFNITQVDCDGDGEGDVCDLIDVPEILSQPQGQTVCAGESSSFTANVNGVNPLTYQWRRNGQDILGATDNPYIIDPVLLGDAGEYDVIVTNVCGSATSDLVPLAVITVLKCDDANSCTANGCTAGVCVNPPTPGVVCESGDSCTVGECDDVGVCVGFPRCQLYADVFPFTQGAPNTNPIGNCVVDLDDILTVLSSFSAENQCGPDFPDTVNTFPCGQACPDGNIDLDDILSTLAAFSGTSGCPHPCPPSP